MTKNKTLAEIRTSLKFLKYVFDDPYYVNFVLFFPPVCHSAWIRASPLVVLMNYVVTTSCCGSVDHLLYKYLKYNTVLQVSDLRVNQ